MASVVSFHFWPDIIPGGYVGVDVFFAISGYLIIGHLLRDVERTQTVSLLGFWARRARRLLPASLTVLLVTAVAVVVWVPQVYWIQFLQEVGASAIYLQNWLLAANAVDYLGAANVASPVQHFWSLSVEEQFYIAWPLIILAVLAVLGILRRRGLTRAVLGWVLVALTLLSAVYSVYLTKTDGPAAYFVTTTRAWEFAAGGLLAWLMMRFTLRGELLKAVVSWAGLSLILVTAFLYTRETPFPGYAAGVPVLGTLLVIGAGLSTARLSPSWFVVRLRPVQWLGDVSYSLYLWHWPFLVIAPIALHTDLTATDKVVVVVVVLVVSWASKRFIEDRFRYSDILRHTPRMAVIAAVVASSLVLGGSVAVTTTLESQLASARARGLELLASGAPCLGAAAFGPGIDCSQPFAWNALTDPALAAQDIGKGVQVKDQCKQTLEDPAVIACDLGDLDDPVRTIALVGDSHAGQFLEPLQIYAKQHSWKVITYLKSWCIGTGATDVAAHDSTNSGGVTSCTSWGDAVIDSITSDPTIDAVVFSNFTQRYVTGVPASLGRPVAAPDFQSAWGRVASAGKKVVVIRDLPNSGTSITPQCIAQHPNEYDPCPTTRVSALPAVDPQWKAAKADPSIGTIDLADRLCDAMLCHTLIGGVIVYLDNNHLTATYARTLAPFLGQAIESQLGK